MKYTIKKSDTVRKVFNSLLTMHGVEVMRTETGYARIDIAVFADTASRDKSEHLLSELVRYSDSVEYRNHGSWKFVFNGYEVYIDDCNHAWTAYANNLRKFSIKRDKGFPVEWGYAHAW